MSELLCLAFPGRDTADRVLNDLRTLQVGYLIDLEDACVVVRDRQGKIHMKQAVNLVAPAVLSAGSWGGLIGLLVGLLLASPLIGLISGVALGAGYGVLIASLADYGINDDYIRGLGSSLKPETSALFVLIRKVTTDKVLDELSHYEGTVLRTSLSRELEDQIRSALAPKLHP